MSVSIETIMAEVRPDVMGCPDPLIEQKVREVLQDFCGSTHIVNRYAYADSSTTLDADYALANFECCDIMLLIVDGVEYEARRKETNVSDDELDDIEVAGAKFWYPSSGGSVTIFPFESTPTTIRARLALRPTMSVDLVDDLFYQDWHKTIVAGTKAELMKMPKKAWTDLKAAEIHEKAYQDGRYVALIAVQKTLDNTSKTKPVRRI